MFAIIDIETCGGKFEYRRGRVTEICIVKHDGLAVVDKFTTLINPECNISAYFSGITGITNDMVADAPKFHEVAGKILEMTEGCVFVAHNVGFDYGFIREEFASLGYKYQRDTLCTVRMSRKLLPGRISYSLGHLCASLGIEIFGRHRAEGDAVATAQLFELLLRLKADDPRYRTKGVTEMMTRRVDKIREHILRKLPESCGVYYFLDQEGNIIYVGKSTNMYTRAIAHFNSDEKKGRKMLFEMTDVDFVETGSELVALLLEGSEIKRHKPKYNRMRKAAQFSHAIDTFTDEKGIINYRIALSEECSRPLVQFSNYLAARERLDQLIEDHTLCLTYTGLASGTAECFHHQIRKCNGICSGLETVDEYNRRALAVMRKFTFTNDDFIILDKGRTPGEHAAIMVREGKYYGYGYLDNSHQLDDPASIGDVIRRDVYYPDCDILVRQYLEKARRKTITLNQVA